MAALGVEHDNDTSTPGFHSALDGKGEDDWVDSDDWFLVGSPAAVLITVLYLLVVRLGMRWMKDRPAYHLTPVLRVYNLVQICLNLFLMSVIFRQSREATDIMYHSCSADLGEANRDTRRAFLVYFWGYLLSKITDLSDTIFFILRKKNSHISFLHIYHHAGMVIFTWVSLRFTKAHQGALPGLINVAVHVVMYTYYFLATFGHPMQRYLWWKRHLTKLQLGQFIIILMYLIGLYYNNCPVSRVFTFIWMFNVTFVFILFIHFYIKTYIFNTVDSKVKAKKQL